MTSFFDLIDFRCNYLVLFRVMGISQDLKILQDNRPKACWLPPPSPPTILGEPPLFISNRTFVQFILDSRNYLIESIFFVLTCNYYLVSMKIKAAFLVYWQLPWPLKDSSRTLVMLNLPELNVICEHRATRAIEQFF